MVVELLSEGSKNAISGNDLCRALHLKSTRELQQIIAIERKNGAVILSTCNGNGGYYLPSGRTELKEFIKTLSNRANHTLDAIKSAKVMLKEIETAGEDNT